MAETAIEANVDTIIDKLLEGLFASTAWLFCDCQHTAI